MCEVEQGCPVCGETTPEVHEALFHGIVETPIGMPCCGTSRLSARVVAHARQQHITDHRVAALTEQLTRTRQRNAALAGYVDGLHDTLTELAKRLRRRDVPGEDWNDPEVFGRDEQEPVTLDEILPRPIADSAWQPLVERVWQAVAVDRAAGRIVIGRDQVGRILAALRSMQDDA